MARSLLALGALGLLIASPTLASADCMERCGARVTKCESTGSKDNQKCLDRAEKRKASYLKRVAKRKNQDKYAERAQKAFDKRKANCDKHKGLNDRWCTVIKRRCERKCSKAKPAKKAALRNKTKPKKKAMSAKKAAKKAAKKKTTKKVVKKAAKKAAAKPKRAAKKTAKK